MSSRRIDLFTSLAARVWRIGFFAAGCCATMAGVASGEAPPARLMVALTYQSPADLRGCPTDAEFRGAVIRHLGRDPFRPVADHRVAAEITATEQGLEGRLFWLDAGGNKEGERRFSARNGDCAALAKGVTFAVAVQIQLLDAGLDRPATTTTTPVTPPPPSQPVAAPPPPTAVTASSVADAVTVLTPAAAPRTLAVGVGATVARGAAPSINEGARAFLRWRRQALSVELGAEATFPVSLRLDDGTGFSTTTLAATLAPCGHRGRLALCAVGAFGWLRASGFGVDDARTPSAFVARLGGRIAFEQPLSPRWAAAAHLDGLGALTPRTIWLNGAPAWSMPAFALGLGVDLVLRLHLL